MTSTWLLLTIFGIWALMVMPMWINDKRRESAVEVRDFRTAMETLGDGMLIPERASGLHVAAKRAPRTGSGVNLRRKLLKQRRMAFIAALATWPFSLALQLSGLTPATIWVLPPLSFVTFVIFARRTLAKARAARNRAIGRVDQQPTATSKPVVERAARARSTKQRTARRSPFAEGLAAIQRNTMRKLTATEPELKTNETAAWQPAVEESADAWIAKPWTAPAVVLPAYVNAPAATAVPRELDRSHGTWGGGEMVAAAKAQQELADFVSEIVDTAPPGAKIVSDDSETGELFRILGA